MANQIHWFPGHMSKALRNVEDKIKIIDVVIELFDARAPLSSINPQLDDLTKNKKRLIVLTKSDLADPSETKKWETYLLTKYDSLLSLNLTDGNAANVIAKTVSSLGQEKWAKDKSKGMKPQPLKTMILGIPNVGKSSLINRYAKRKAAGVQNKPGFTRGEQWIKVNNEVLLLDTPGILPMNYDDKKKAANLALIGSIREDILPNNELVHILLKYLKENYPTALNNRFNIPVIEGDDLEILNHICEVRKILDSKGQNDIVRAESVLLKEFKDGLLGKITLEKI